MNNEKEINNEKTGLVEDNIEDSSNVIKVRNSKIKKIKEPDFSKEIVIERVRLLPKHVYDSHYQMMKKAFPNIHAIIPNQQICEKLATEFKNQHPELDLTAEQLEQQIYELEIARRINSLVIRDAIFNEAMKILVPCYEININPNDFASYAELLKKSNSGLAQAPNDYIDLLAKRTIEKELVFTALAREWKLTVSDDDARKVLMDYYRSTNESVREKLNDPNELERIKSTLYEQAIANKICSLVKYKLDMDSINKHAEEDKTKAREYLKQMEEQAKKAEEEAKKAEAKLEKAETDVKQAETLAKATETAK